MNRVINIAFCIILLLFANTLNAQNKNIIGLNIGISLPLSDFSHKTFNNANNNNTGFASVGANFQFDYYRYTGKYFALSLNIGYANFKFNNTDYLNEYKRILNKQNGIKVETDNYQFIKGTFGLVFKTPKIHNFELLINPQIGYSLGHHPKIKVFDNLIGEINSVKKDNDYGLFVNIDAKLNYYFTEKYGISFSYNRNLTEYFFDDETSYNKTFSLPVSFHNFNIGLTICL